MGAHANKEEVSVAYLLSKNDANFYRAVIKSLGFHAILVLIYVFKSFVLPGPTETFLPTMRVDLVALPDVLKKDLDLVSDKGAPSVEKKEIKVEKVQKSANDEMILKKKSKDARKQKILNSLARIKALSKISDDVAGDEVPAFKGNKLSQGVGRSGEGAGSTSAMYFDQVRVLLKRNWSLPVWLSRQNLSARVQIFVDKRGHIDNYYFEKKSGNMQFDEAVRQVLLSSQPFPPPPASILGSLLQNGILIGFPL